MSQLAITSPVLLSIKEMEEASQVIAKSGLFGVKSPEQAMVLMMLCQAEGIPAAMFGRRYHIIDGKPSMRADTMQAEFESREGVIIWHIRNEVECSATYFKGSHSEEVVKRAIGRYKAMKALERTKAIKDAEEKEESARGILDTIADLSYPGEVTIIRTIEEAWDCEFGTTYDQKGKKIWKDNWWKSPRQMLHARNVSEGVRSVMPGVIAGVYTEDEIDGFEPLRESRSLNLEDKSHREIDMERRNEDIQEREIQRLMEQGYTRAQAEDLSAPAHSETPKKGQPERHEAEQFNLPMEAEESKPEPVAIPWREVECIAPTTYKGKKLGDLSATKLRTLNDKWVVPNTAKIERDPVLMAYAKAIQNGVMELSENAETPDAN
jgi:hypothetical protein